MNAITLHSPKYPLQQENRVDFPSAAQEAEFLRVMGVLGFSLKKEAFTLMHIAATLGDPAECKRLITSGWDPNEVGECGFCPYFLAQELFRIASNQLGHDNPATGAYREIVCLLFDALYAKEGLANPQAQYKAFNYGNIFRISKNLLEGQDILLQLCTRLSFDSKDELVTLHFLNQVHSEEEMETLFIGCAASWSQDALISFLPKLTPQAQIALLNTAQKISHEELFCNLWDKACLEAKNGRYWMHGAVQSGRNRIIAHFLKNTAYNVQSTDTGGRTVLHWATANRDKIDPQLFEEITIRDGEHSKALFEARVFGHRFSLSGPFMERVLKYESRQLVSILANSIREWSTTWQGSDQESLCKRIDRVCAVMILSTQDIPSDQLYEKAQSGSVLMLSGPTNHAIDFILHRDQLIKIDTGTGKERGGKSYDITNLDQEKIIKAIELLRKETVAKSTKEHADYWRDDQLSHRLFKESWMQIKQDLGLKKSSYTPHAQTVENCAWEAHKIAIFSLFFLDITQEIRQGSLDVDSAFSQDSSFQSSWTAFDYTKGFREGLPYVSQLGVDMPNSIFSKVIQHCLLQSTPFQAKIEQPIIDILNIDPSMSNWTWNGMALLNRAQIIQLDNVCAHLKKNLSSN